MPAPKKEHAVVRPKPLAANASINITPMIDVLLVLLVIFMAALPLSQRGLDTQLPPATTAPDARPPDGQIVVEYTADRKLSVNRAPLSLDDLPSRLREIYVDRRDKTLYVMGDGQLRYGDIVEVIDAAKGAGVEKGRHRHRLDAEVGSSCRAQRDSRPNASRTLPGVPLRTPM